MPDSLYNHTLRHSFQQGVTAIWKNAAVNGGGRMRLWTAMIEAEGSRDDDDKLKLWVLFSCCSVVVVWSKK